ncbi:M10 family metallopeptidase C-terminal domain-containing protein [Pararhizobium gei]|uniref:M10 family metallopeptidase C-terminal domain-containing protein n=1 Tax=Pararhizobium gei TaxID=1395951 RepID=UPI0023DA7E3E|nr:hypothetical protein [Rhizobium gei]
MATFNFAASGYAIDFSTTSTNLLFQYDFASASSTKLKLYDNSSNYTSFGGTGFKYVVKSGFVTDVTAGKVQSLDVVIKGVTTVKITGLDVSAARLYDAAAAEDDALFVNLLLAGNDTINGTSSADIINSGTGDDVIKGNGGNDKIRGAAGADDLYGGTGKDFFVFKSVKDSTSSVGGRDTIFDFNGSGGDRIKLNDIDANTKLSHDQAFSFIGTKAFSGHAGELRYEKKASDTYVYADVNGDKKVDFAIHFDDAITLQKDFFIL